MSCYHSMAITEITVSDGSSVVLRCLVVCIVCVYYVCCWFAYRISYSKWPEIGLNFSVNWIIWPNGLSFNLGQNWKCYGICFIHLANGIIWLHCLLCSASNCVINAVRHKTTYGLSVIVLWILNEWLEIEICFNHWYIRMTASKSLYRLNTLRWNCWSFVCVCVCV